MANGFGRDLAEVSTSLLSTLGDELQKRRDRKRSGAANKEKQVRQAVTSLSRSGDHRGRAALQEFARTGGDPSSFESIQPLDPDRAEALDQAAIFSKIGLANEQSDFARDVLGSAGVDASGIKPQRSKVALANQRDASAEFDRTRSAELARVNTARIAKMEADSKAKFLKAKEALRRGSGKGFNQDINQFNKETTKRLEFLRGLINEDGGTTIIPERIKTGTGETIQNPAYIHTTNEIKKLVKTAQAVGASSNRRRLPIVGQSIKEAQQRTDIRKLIETNLPGMNFTDETIEDFIKNPNELKKLRALSKAKRLLDPGVE